MSLMIKFRQANAVKFRIVCHGEFNMRYMYNKKKNTYLWSWFSIQNQQKHFEGYIKYFVSHFVEVLMYYSFPNN